MSQKQGRGGTGLALRAGDREGSAQSTDMGRRGSDFAPSLDALDVAVARQSRVVQFPQGRSMGPLWTRDWGDPYGDHWRFFDVARGAVAVPAGKELQLLVSSEVSGNLSALATLEPDDLQSLIVDRTLVTDADLAYLQRPANLRSLTLWFTRVTDAGLAVLRRLTNLEELELWEPQVTWAGLANLQYLINLRKLHLGGTQVTSAGLTQIQTLANLQSLYLRFTQLTDAGLVHLQRLVNLRSLGLGGAQITGAGLAYVQGLANLQWLDLGDTQVTDVGLAQVERLTELRWLGLAGTHITDAALSHLQNLANLRKLDLGRTQVTTAGVAKLRSALPDCAIMVVSSQRAMQGRQPAAAREDVGDRVRHFVCSVSECPEEGYYPCLGCGEDFCRNHIAVHCGGSRLQRCPRAEKDPCRYCGRLASVQIKCGRVCHRCAVAIFERVYAPSGKRLGF